jgi:multidrug efflux system membrane fusion protein
VNVRLKVRTLSDAVVVPAAAVQFGSRGTYVYIVTDDNKSSIRNVVLGPSDGTYQAVTEGLKGGEPVVLEGLDRLREGKNVIIVADAPAPAAGADGAAKTKGGRGKKGGGEGKGGEAAGKSGK